MPWGPNLAAKMQRLHLSMVRLPAFSRLLFSMDLFEGVCFLKMNMLKYKQVSKTQRLTENGVVII